MAIVLITGCSSGFGKLAALEFARRGDRVFASMRDTSKQAPLLDAAKQAGVDVEVVQLDVTDRGSAEQSIADIVRRAGRLDVLVNNAGIGIHGPVEEVEDDELARVFETNVFGLMRVLRPAAAQMREQKSGTIINVSSLAGKVSSPFGGVYSASKHAVEALSDALYYELHPFGVRVVVVEPGGFETQFGANRILERRFTEGSPYVALERRFMESQARLPGREHEANPQTVANTIVDAAHDSAPKRRYLVGGDAQMIGGLHKQASDEDFEKAMRTALDFWD